MRQVLFLCNPQAGKGRAERRVEAAAELFRAAGWVVSTEAIDFRRNPLQGYAGVQLIVVSGGDGTVNYVVNALKHNGLDITLGIIPSGTANDFARALGMSRRPERAAQQLLAGSERRIDCGRVNNDYFINIFSFGIFTTTSQRTSDRRKQRIGKLAYVIEGVREFRAMHGIPLQISADGRDFDFHSLMALIFNGETAGGFPLAAGASLDDGLFDCLLLKRRGSLRATWAMLLYLAGGRPRSVKHFRARRIDISSPLNEPTDADGQKGADFPLHIECLAGGLRIICPPAEMRVHRFDPFFIRPLVRWFQRGPK